MQIKYQNIILRDYREADIEDDVRWRTEETAWMLWDAPWETDEDGADLHEDKLRERFTKFLHKPKEGHRLSMEIDTADGVHIGVVTAYCIDDEYSWQENLPKERWGTARWALGIDVCESNYWSEGWGTQAFTAFVKYFLDAGYRDLYTQTWSGNEWMIGLAKKLGFRECCRKVGIREVRGGNYDGLTFRLEPDAFREHCAKLASIDEELYLHVPAVEDMWFCRTLQEDPETMSYNAGWDIDFDGYHPETGCIDFPPEMWSEKWENWVGREPERFYAFVREKKTGNFVCEVCFHYTEENKWHDMGVLLYAPYRGRGYGTRCLALLLYHAFAVCGIERLHNDFEETRLAAMFAHRRAGFKEVGESHILRFGESVRVVDLLLTKEEYLSSHPEYR